MTTELWFHAIEIVVMFFGVAVPIIWGVVRISSLLKDFPPHRHVNGQILYPSGYEPTETGQLRQQ